MIPDWFLPILALFGVWVLIVGLVLIHFRLLQLENAVYRMLERYEMEHPADRWDNDNKE